MGARRLVLRGDGLAVLLPLSIVLHLALIAFVYPGRGVAGDHPLATRGGYLAATLSDSLTDSPALRAPRAAGSAPPAGQPAPRRASPPPTSAMAPPVPAADATPYPALLPRSVYYPSAELTVKPTPLGEPALDPQQLATLVATGELVLTLWIDADGEVVELTVDDSDLPAAFAQAAASAFTAQRFIPGELNGQKVGSVMRIAVRYDDTRLAGD